MDPVCEKKKTTGRRMAPEHLFKFNCSPGVSCFTQCCGDVTIVLTPYDLVRLKNRLGISSDQFLEKHTLVIPRPKRVIPMVVLKMNEGDKKCPFVTAKGCAVYEDRPWACRMYPLNTEGDGTYDLVSNAEKCMGLQEEARWKIQDWLEGQGILPYEEMNELLSTITIPMQVHESEIENPQVAKMVFMCLYNVDKFKDFVFKSSFLDRFEVEEPERIDLIRDNDVELLKFAMDWIKFGVFGEKLFWVKEAARGR
jgi:Fe-S-cluster containining protein